MAGDPRAGPEDCWWCLGEGIVFGPGRDRQHCPMCGGSGNAKDGVSPR